MHFTYHRRIQVPKKGRHCWPPTFSTLAPPMDAKYYCNRFIAFHCHSSRKFRIRLASIAVANSDSFCIFAPPYSMTCIRLWFLNFQKWQTYVNNLVHSLSNATCCIQNRFTNMPVICDKKKVPETHSFCPPNTPLLRIFEISFFRNVDHVEAKQMPFEFKKSTGKKRRYQGGVLNNPPATNRGSQEPATNRVKRSMLKPVVSKYLGHPLAR